MIRVGVRAWSSDFCRKDSQTEQIIRRVEPQHPPETTSKDTQKNVFSRVSGASGVGVGAWDLLEIGGSFGSTQTELLKIALICEA